MASTEKPATCAGCDVTLVEPYIKCIECAHNDLLLCLYCFARGREMKLHRNVHKYEVLKSDFCVLDAGWTAGDELKLLEAITQCGHGNWSDIGRKVRKPAGECRRHYTRVYIDNNKGHFETLEDRHGGNTYCPIVLKCVEAPPRPADNSGLHIDMSLYSAARGDFGVEYDNYAELDLKNIDFQPDKNNTMSEGLSRELQLSVLDVYRRVLKERFRRKAIVREHGLINIRRNYIFEKRYHRTLGADVVNTLHAFVKHLPPVEWDKMLESYHQECVIKKEIRQLFEMRRQGITRLLSARIYDELRQRREQSQRSLHLLDDAISSLRKEQWVGKQVLLGNIGGGGFPTTLPLLAKREMRRLDIVGLPSFDKLNEEEREFCSTCRYVPETFIQHRKLLIAENYKHGQVKLAAARALLKIDVNKTRRIYDFLADRDLITKDPEGPKRKRCR